MNWNGVIPALTTEFDETLGVDHGFLAEHCTWLLESGCRGVVALGSLGEGGSLARSEKLAVLGTCRAAVKDAPLVAGIAAITTADAVELARMAEGAGCDGLMVLPPYVYHGDWHEMKAHVGAVLRATKLPAILYNNPVAYATDFLPEQIAELAREHSNLEAVKESSTDVRRVAAVREACGERISILAGVDDAAIESALFGAVGWIAGVANALPAESVAAFEAARAGRAEEAWAIYRWMLPLLRMDTVPKFVQLIKLMQAELGHGSARVRAPRLELSGAELEEARLTIHAALKQRASAPERVPAGARR